MMLLNMLWFFAGGGLGFFVTAIMAAAGSADAEIERERRFVEGFPTAEEFVAAQKPVAAPAGLRSQFAIKRSA